MIASRMTLPIALIALLLAGCGEDRDVSIDITQSGDADSDIDGDADVDIDSPETPHESLAHEDMAPLCWFSRFVAWGFVSVRDVIALDDNSSLITGYYSGLATFGFDEEITEELVPTPGWNDEGFLARIDEDGAVVWAKKVGATSENTFGAPLDVLAATPDGGFVGAGFFVGIATLGAGEENETILDSSDGSLLLARYDSNGELVWARNDGEQMNTWASAVALLSDGSIIVAGGIDGETTFGLGGTSETTIPDLNEGSYRPFLARYTSNGDLMWARGQGGKDIGRAIGIGADDTVAVGGYYLDDQYCILGEGDPTETTLPEPGGIFLAAFDPNEGDLEWARAATNNDDFLAHSTTAMEDGSWVMSGQYVTDALFDDDTNPVHLIAGAGESEDEGYLARYSQDGDLQWAVSTSSPYGSVRGPLEATALSDGDLLLTGAVQGTATFGEGSPDPVTLPNSSNEAAFAAVYDADGELEWALKFLVGMGPGSMTMATAPLDDGSFMVAGSYEFHAQYLVDGYIEISASRGLRDGFLARVCPQ